MARQVAGALACAADVHIITPEGRRPGAFVDSVFTVHKLGTPIDVRAEIRRDLLVEGLSRTNTSTRLSMSRELMELVDKDLVTPWLGGAQVLAGLLPDLAVIIGHRNVGALNVLEQHDADLPMVLLALGVAPNSLGFARFDELFERARTVVAVTEAECDFIAGQHGSATTVRRIGAPLTANWSALAEPSLAVGTNNYALVLTGVALGEDHSEAELSRLLTMRFPDVTIGISHTDAFCVFKQGRLEKSWPIERSSDLTRLLAWARVTVDLRPGRLFARRCVESLLFGTPIVVPAIGRARDLAERSRGGLWFRSPSELTWCTEALLEGPARDIFGQQGRSYAEEEFGSTDRFIQRVLESSGQLLATS
jgi:hypothetical protein